MQTLDFPPRQGPHPRGDLHGLRYDAGAKDRQMANRRLQPRREAAAVDVALERRFNVFITDAIRAGIGAPWARPLVHETRDQMDYVDSILASILAKFVAIR
ncbi:MAG: hypothetical protein VXY70_09590, partial [Actinomycetota bacterium]|nr:hypothetical protein [Actinomycetota bacterium]